MSQADLQNFTKSWPARQKAIVSLLVYRYGLPNQKKANTLLWKAMGKWRMVKISPAGIDMMTN